MKKVKVMLEIFRILLYGRYKNKLQKILNIHFRYETPHARVWLVTVTRLFLGKHFWIFSLKVLKIVSFMTHQTWKPSNFQFSNELRSIYQF